MTLSTEEKAAKYDAIIAVMSAHRFELLAAWLDKYDTDRGKAANNEVQQDLRKVRDIIDPKDWDVRF